MGWHGSAEAGAQKGNQPLQGSFGIEGKGKIRDGLQVLRSAAQSLRQGRRWPDSDARITPPAASPAAPRAERRRSAATHRRTARRDNAGQQIAFRVQAAQQSHENHASAPRIAGHFAAWALRRLRSPFPGEADGPPLPFQIGPAKPNVPDSPAPTGGELPPPAAPLWNGNDNARQARLTPASAMMLRREVAA